MLRNRIYKPKYADDGDKSNERLGRAATAKQTTTTPPEKKPRDKSRTRTMAIFGRKKSVSVKP